ncbi:MAG: hypothetical protein AUJ85_10635 [Elusimicrobia bacterium CG1_02_37_114]|nr:MAG: hypothetical protein AUJ85_10635 [Elusimicrobia bacterium CG1_02_37_114]PIV53818.1 MAG: hypothetical protein COS17_01910 [Elusimicrobia bacterium CG02_land_8_20_14_3_00_37_13]PIZ12775.1 MAG: hypothetical protein COY53_08305 [Elusimicrobia bacterium CG_4_10_14_0_8_um_filter_37_32]
MILQAIEILRTTWVKSVFDLAHLSAYLTAKKIYPDLIFVCADSILANSGKKFVDETYIKVV